MIIMDNHKKFRQKFSGFNILLFIIIIITAAIIFWMLSGVGEGNFFCN